MQMQIQLIPYWYGCQNKRLLEQGIVVPESRPRALPDWLFPNGTVSSAQHRSRPDAVFVHSIPEQSPLLDPTEIPPQDRDNHIFEFLIML
eukprot:1143969-Pelagomonas_calceolata.AAC.2